MTEQCDTCEHGHAGADHPGRFPVSRRSLLSAGAAAAGLMALPGTRLSFAADAKGSGRTLVVLYLRGAADGLSLIPPVGDSAYAQLRPTVAIPAAKALPLDRTFGLHPAMKSLMPYYASGQLALVHATGDPDNTRSHFDMQDATERWAQPGSALGPGWISTWLHGRKEGPGTFPSLAIGGRQPVSLQGEAPSIALNSIDDFALTVSEKQRPKLEKALRRMYGAARPDLNLPAELALQTMAKLAPYRGKPYVPSNGAVYPSGTLGFQLSQVALLMHAKIGLSAVAIDVGGWDTHVGMGGASGGQMYTLAEGLAQSMSAFAQDLGRMLNQVSLVTMTEFGRTAQENGSNGTDHGMGSAMMILGRTPAAFKGGKVTTQWPGLAGALKDPNLDLAITTDYRDVLKAVISTVG